MYGNNITGLTEEDIELIELFKVVDLRGNPLNCFFDFETLNDTIVLSNCTSHTTPSVGQWTSRAPSHNYQTPSEANIEKKHTIQHREHTHRKDNSKWLWLITVPVGIMVGVCVLWFLRKMQQRERIIHNIPIELEVLRRSDEEEDDDNDEITLFETKEKQL